MPVDPDTSALAPVVIMAAGTAYEHRAPRTCTVRPNKRGQSNRHPTFAEPSADEPIRQPTLSEINPNQLIRAFDSRRH
jgi:hypothetical protein